MLYNKSDNLLCNVNTTLKSTPASRWTFSFPSHPITDLSIFVATAASCLLCAIASDSRASNHNTENLKLYMLWDTIARLYIMMQMEVIK